MTRSISLLAYLVLMLLVACQPTMVAEPAANPPAEASIMETETAVSSPTSEPVPATLTPPPLPAEQIVRFAVSEWEKSNYQTVITDFETENPDYKIELISIDEVVGELHTEEQFAQLAPHADVFSTGPAYSAIPSGFLLDLSPFFEADPTISEEDFYPSLLEPYHRNGGLWGLPIYPFVEFINYNKDLFDQAGLEYPQPGWTYDDMLSTAQALTLKVGDAVTQWGFVQPYQTDAMPFLRGQTEQAYNLFRDPPLINLNTPEAIDAIQWYVDLIQTHEVAPNTREWSEPATSLVDNGQAAMWTDYLGGVDAEIVPFPIDTDERKSSPTYSLGLGISATTPNPEAAWAWLAYLSAHPIPTPAGAIYTPLPARQSVAESSGYWDKIGAEKAAAYRFALDHAYAKDAVLPYSPVNNEIGEILMGNKDVPTAMIDAQTNTEIGLEMTLTEHIHQDTTP